MRATICLSIIILSISSWARPEEKTRYIVGVENQLYYPHYHYENNKFSGFARAILDRFADKNNYIFEYRALPVDELFQQLIAREIDFKYPDNPYWQHEVKEGVRVAYSDPVTPYFDGVSVLKERKGQGVKNLKKIGTIKGFTPLSYEYLIQTGKIELLESQSSLELIQWALSGKVDGIYANVDVIAYQLLKKFNQLDTLTFDISLPYTASTYMLSTTNRPRVLKKFNRFLINESENIKKMKKDFGIKNMEDNR